MEMNEFELFMQVHAGLPRWAPGSTEITTRAYRTLSFSTASPCILDVGCGQGASAMVLSRVSGGTVIAADLQRSALTGLMERLWAQKTREQGDVLPVRASMDALPFRERSFHLIWSEGAAYIMGFVNALTSWRPLLKDAGFMVVSDIAWLTPDPPDEVRKYLEAECPGMFTPERHREIIAGAGFLLLDSFVLPESAWWNYYNPLSARMKRFRNEWADNPAGQRVLDTIEEEIAMFERYSSTYGYVMYMMQTA